MTTYKSKVTDVYEKLSIIYWTSKLKNPTKAKFIIAAPKCSVKPPSKAVTAELKLIYNQMEHLSNIILVLKLSGQVRNCHQRNN